MAFDFPNAPAIGAVYSPGAGLPSYRWDGTGWNALPPVFVNTARRGNLVVNGNMMISQENGTTLVAAAGAYPADQWKLNFSGVTPQSQQSNSITGNPTNNRSALVQNFTAAKASLAAGDFCVLQNTMEGLNVNNLGWGTASAIPAVARFSAFCDTPGAYTFGVRSASGTIMSFTKLVNMTAAPLQTFVVPIPAQTAGTWSTDNTGSLIVNICTGAGTSFTAAADNAWASGTLLASPGQTNLAAATGKSLIITDVGLYADPDNTGLPPPWEVPDYATELARCLRYYESSSYSAQGYNIAGNLIQHTTSFAVFKRITPALTTSFTGLSNANGGAQGATPTRIAMWMSATAAGSSGWTCNWTANARM